jgi:hypothetical protein
LTKPGAFITLKTPLRLWTVGYLNCVAQEVKHRFSIGKIRVQPHRDLTGLGEGGRDKRGTEAEVSRNTPFHLLDWAHTRDILSRDSFVVR